MTTVEYRIAPSKVRHLVNRLTAWSLTLILALVVGLWAGYGPPTTFEAYGGLCLAALMVVVVLKAREENELKFTARRVVIDGDTLRHHTSESFAMIDRDKIDRLLEGSKGQLIIEGAGLDPRIAISPHIENRAALRATLESWHPIEKLKTQWRDWLLGVGFIAAGLLDRWTFPPMHTGLVVLLAAVTIGLYTATAHYWRHHPTMDRASAKNLSHFCLLWATLCAVDTLMYLIERPASSTAGLL